MPRPIPIPPDRSSKGASTPSPPATAGGPGGASPVPLAAPPQIPVLSAPVAGATAPQPVDSPAPMAVPVSQARPIPLPAGARLRPVLVGAKTQELIHETDAPHEQPTEAMLRRSPPWLVSAIVHAAIIIVMALVVYVQQRDDRERFLFFSDRLGDFESDSPVELEGEETLEETVMTPDDLAAVDDPFAAPPKMELDLGQTAASDLMTPIAGIALRGRDEGMRKVLAERFGGDALTEEAVELALAWLAQQQQPDGSWSLKGPYSMGSPQEDRTAATAMAMLAFQGTGNTHERGTYREQVKGGLTYLRSKQQPNGDLFDGDRSHNWLYSHAQGSIALCELYAMSGDTGIRTDAEKAIQFCLDAQHAEGGWRYKPAVDHDTSVTGWMLMALQSARMGELEVPVEAFARASKYLDAAQHEGGARYSYIPGSFPDPVMTAEGVLCRQYLGWEQYDPRMTSAAEYLLLPENRPSLDDRNVYYWYYATQMLHHLEGEHWTTWNNLMKPVLVKSQVTKGPERGSWDPLEPQPDRWGSFGGRLYVTCLSTFVLEVYYRHLPLYHRGELIPGR